MDGLELNKIAASVLVAGIVIMLVSNIADILYKPEKEFKRGYEVEVSEDVASHGPDVKEDKPIDVAAVMAKADSTRGQTDIKKCSICHTFTKGGANKVGPNLFGIVGAKKAHKDDFTYSKTLATKGGSWSKEDLLHFIISPRKFLPGTKMAFAGYKNPQDAADVVAYLETLK